MATYQGPEPKWAGESGEVQSEKPHPEWKTHAVKTRVGVAAGVLRKVPYREDGGEGQSS